MIASMAVTFFVVLQQYFNYDSSRIQLPDVELVKCVEKIPSGIPKTDGGMVDKLHFKDGSEIRRYYNVCRAT